MNPTAHPTVERGLAALAPVLAGDQRAFLDASGRPDALTQPGGACLDGPFPVPCPMVGDPTDPSPGEPCLETFVVDRATDGVCTIEATGTDAAVADWWRPTVAALVERVVGEADRAGVRLGFPAYVSVSTTSLAEVVAEPHIDDDQPRPEAGVGLVAIAASHAGTRVTRGVIGCRTLRPPAPVEPAPEALAAYDPGPAASGDAASDDAVSDDAVSGDAASGDAASGGVGATIEEFPAERIVVLARFGQLHAGPRPADVSAVAEGSIGADRDRFGTRSLLVLRADTIPG